MYIYFGIIAYQIILISLLKKYNLKSNFLTATVPFICMFVLAAFRSRSVGNDSGNYLDLFNQIRNGANLEVWSERYEWGYLLFNKIVGCFFSNQYAIFFTSALFIYLISWVVIKRLSYECWLSVFLFITLGLFSNSVNVIRLTMAYVICLFAYIELEKKKYMKFIIFVIFATLFHTSAIVFIVALPCNRLRMKKRFLFIWSVITGMLFILFNTILANVLKYKNSYNTYITSGTYFDSGYLAIGLNIGVWILVLLTVYVIYRNGDFELEKSSCFGGIYIGTTKYWEKLCIYGLIMISLYICGLKINLMDRVAGYFRCLMIILIPNAMMEIKNKRTRGLAKVAFILLMIMFFVIPLLFRPEWTGIDSYSFWFDNN